MIQIPLYAIIGTRAQLIKMAPVLSEMQKSGLKYTFIYTAQHRETIQELLNEFDIKKPDINFTEYFSDEAKTLGLFVGWLWKMIFLLLFKRNEIIEKSGGIVLTHGDTATAVWGAALGRLTGNKVMHIESGLRSYNLFEPFPEEINRLIIFQFTDIFACPGYWAVKNVKRYGGHILNTKVNTLYDATQLAISKKDKYVNKKPKDKFIVVSIHRFENIFNKQRLLQIIEMLEENAKKFTVLFILHPSTKKQLEKSNFLERLNKNKKIKLKPRIPYIEFVNLLDSSEFVITDGGSNQEELSYLGKPTLLLRKATERTEGLEKNIKLSGLDYPTIRSFINNYKTYKKSSEISQNYNPSKIITKHLLKYR